jgi:hypothetical protein
VQWRRHVALRERGEHARADAVPDELGPMRVGADEHARRNSVASGSTASSDADRLQGATLDAATILDEIDRMTSTHGRAPERAELALALFGGRVGVQRRHASRGSALVGNEGRVDVGRDRRLVVARLHVDDFR